MYDTVKGSDWLGKLTSCYSGVFYSRLFVAMEYLFLFCFLDKLKTALHFR